MNKKIMAILTVVTWVSCHAMYRDLAGTACTIFTPATFSILPFEDERDRQDFLNLANSNREFLIPQDDFSFDDMLISKSMTPQDPTTHNSLIIKVLRAPGLQTNATMLKGFAAYALVDTNYVQGCLLAVAETERRNHYAQYLVRHTIDDAFGEKNAIKLTARVNRFNVATQILYKKVAGLYPNLKLEIKEATEIIKDDSRARDSLVFELTKK